MQKGISIILPTLNRADYLASTVDCLIEQDFGEPYEIIIVDQSAAIDSTMYSRAKDSDTLIKYYHVTEFRGLPEARNFGVQHTQYVLHRNKRIFYIYYSGTQYEVHKVLLLSTS